MVCQRCKTVSIFVRERCRICGAGMTKVRRGFVLSCVAGTALTVITFTLYVWWAVYH
jgi:hypothetical protein